MRTPPMEAGWFYSPRQIVHYFLTRPTTLKPPRVCAIRGVMPQMPQMPS